MSTFAPLAVAVPLLLAAALVAVTSWIGRRTADLVAIAGAIAVTVICALLVVHTSRGLSVYWFGGWRPHNGITLGISFAVDQLGAGLATFVGLLMIAALIFAYRHVEAQGGVFNALMLVFLAAMVGFCLTGDLFNMFVFFELLGVAAIALTAYRADQRAPLEGSLNFAVTNTVGAFLVLSGIALLYGRTGALNLAQIGHVLAQGRVDGLVVVAFALIVCGFFIKAAIVPFHFWLADAYTVAPTPVCIVFAGVMSELGLYAVARIYWTVFDGTLSSYHSQVRLVLVIAGVLTAVVGAVMCLVPRHLKRLLAFVTISHLGLMLVGIGLLTVNGLSGTAVYLVVDGLVKASLFICVGIVQYRRAEVHELRLRGLGRGLPLTGVLFALGGVALAALPPFRTFLGKSLTQEQIKHGYQWVPYIYVLVSVLTGGAVLRAAARVFLGWGAQRETHPAVERLGEESQPPDQTLWRAHTPRLLFVPAVALLAGGIVADLLPGFLAGAQEAAARFKAPGAYDAAVLYSQHIGQLPTPAFTTTEDLAYGAASIGGAVAFALLLLFGGRLPRRPPAAITAGVHGAMGRLRALHSGQPGDYVAWLTAGVAVFGGAFALALH